MDTRRFFISGIGTDVGKTIVSAVIVQKLGASYWKPIQTGISNDSDRETVSSLISNPLCHMIPESIALERPLSPHEAAQIENRNISLSDFLVPEHKGDLVIEGAGGLLVPLNDKEVMLDLALQLNAEVILVSRNYLGSINHTLLSLEILRIRQIPFKGIIFCGASNFASEEVILKISGAHLLGRIPHFEKLDQQSIIDATEGIKFD